MAQAENAKTEATAEQIENWISWGKRIDAEFILIIKGEPKFYRVMGESIKRGWRWARSKGTKDDFTIEWVDCFERRPLEEIAQIYKNMGYEVELIKL